MKRSLIAFGATAAILAMAPAPALAHGIGGRTDLPVPLSFFLSAASVVLILSFAALPALWPKPRYQRPPDLTPISIPGFPIIAGALSFLGVAALTLVVTAGIVGVNNSSRNPASVLVWVGFWLVVPFLSAAVGNIYRYLNPWKSLAAWLRIGQTQPGARLRDLGLWPAVILFVSFTWLELVYPDSGSPETVAIAAAVYTAIMLVSADRFGRAHTFENIDAFGVYNRLLSGIAPITSGPDGRPARRRWLHGLAHIPIQPGLDWFLIAMIGTVSFDGLSATPWYSSTFGEFGQTMLGETVGLLAAVAIVGIGYHAASHIAARVGGGSHTGAQIALRFAHTLVPIALAYAFAHYFTLILFEGQLLVSTLSDPLDLGWNVFGTVDRAVDYSLLEGGTLWVWYIQLTAIVAGHLAAVVLAHDRALVDFPPATAVKSQYAMLGLMVALTGLGLAILAA